MLICHQQLVENLLGIWPPGCGQLDGEWFPIMLYQDGFKIMTICSKVTCNVVKLSNGVLGSVLDILGRQMHLTFLPILWILGHRPELNSFANCFKSIFRIHTETGNIWTHLLGAISFIAIAVYVITRPSLEIQVNANLIFCSFVSILFCQNHIAL